MRARGSTAAESNQQQSAFIQAAQEGQQQALTAARSLGQQLFDVENAGGTYNQRQRTNTQFVTDLYFAYLQRAPESSGLGYWVGRLEQPTQPWTRIQARTAFAESGEFVAIVSTVYGINNDNDEIAGRVARYVANIYLAVPGGSGSQANDTATLEAAAAEGQSQAVQAARTIGINLFQPWLTGPQTNQEFVTGLFNAFLQREPSATEVNTWVTTVQSQGRAPAVQSFANLSASQELAGTLYREILWLTPDQLGTPRMISERSGSLTGIKRHDYLPFGEEIFAGTGGRTTTQGYNAVDGVPQKFTSYERDIETGLDYAQARYYANSQGRFTGVDPLMSSAKPLMPQSWNRYSYCLNNPLVFVDPSGLKWYQKTGGDRDYEWHEDNPGDGYTEVTYFVFESKDHGWVYLDSDHNKWWGGYATKVDALEGGNILSDPLRSLDYFFLQVKNDTERFINDPLGRGWLGDPALVMLGAPGPLTG
jgi:RHS repeat-associated protein